MNSKHHKQEPFTIDVCNAIRHHAGEAAAMVSQRGTAFADRDDAVERLGELKGGDSPEFHELKMRHSDSVLLIEKLQAAIRFHEKSLRDIVREADEPHLPFAYDPPDDAREARKADAEKRQGKLANPARPETADPNAPGSGEEHLRASVNELAEFGASEASLVALRGGGYTTIGRVVEAIDGDRDLGAALNADENSMKEIRKAVKQYRAVHRKASREAEA